jgi:hypothetical protein
MRTLFKRFSLYLFLSSLFFGFIPSGQAQTFYQPVSGGFRLTVEGASHLASLPLKCMQQAYPYKTGIVFLDSTYTVDPQNYHPAFYGCFDWHSAVHGHWMLVRLMRLFPELPEGNEIRQKLSQNLTKENILVETQMFEGLNAGFERTYGWAWILQLQTELLAWEDPLGQSLAANMQPLVDRLVDLYLTYLPKMNYPVRSGEHSNLAFGLRLAFDYAEAVGHQPLKDRIRETSMRFYAQDKDGPLAYEPGGADFLSPCLEEADLMWRILPAQAYQKWVKKFLPSLFTRQPMLAPGKVSDRSDGKLVHLDGLNLSRAWCLYGIARHVPAKHQAALHALAEQHLADALPNVVSGDYMGEHWLASFAVYALTAQNTDSL